MKHLQLIQKIWEERVNQNIDSSFVLFGELKKYFHLKNNQTFLEVPIEGLDAQNINLICECLALESSLARAKRNKILSAESLLHIEREIPIETSLNSFIYQFEKAISFFSENEWIESVHHFIKAKNLASNSLQKATCLINLILCSENLDITYSQAHEELFALMGQLDSQIRKGIESQIHSLQLRNKWRNGLLVKQDFTENNLSEINQSSYFLNYIGQIPYLFDAEASSRLEIFVKKPGHLFNKDFRIRTLCYQWSDTDLSSGRLTDHIERIYLWTWKWIENPLKFNIEPLIKAIKSFPWSELGHIDKLSLDNQSQFVLALGWLSYFDNSLSSLHQNFEKKIKFSVNHKYLMAEKNVQIHLLQKIVTDKSQCPIKDAILKIFGKFGIQVIDPVIASKLTIVDLSKFTISLKNDRIIHSKSLALAASLLIEHENIAVDLFFNKTLSHIEYDQFLNAHQISNIIYKLNKIMNPALHVRQKDGLIFATGDKCSLKLKYADQHTQILKSSEEWVKIIQNLRKEFSLIVENKSKNRNRRFLAISIKFLEFKRFNVQKELNISKTEANRLIQFWIRDELIHKKGFGKNTIYYFKNIAKKVS